jgi:phosphocarrier protein HPr
MSQQKTTRSVVVTDPAGVHLRTASAIAAITRRSKSQVEIVSQYHRAKGNDVLDMLALAAPKGSSVTLEATGPDASQVLDALEPLFTGDEMVLAAAAKPVNVSDNENK